MMVGRDVVSAIQKMAMDRVGHSTYFFDGSNILLYFSTQYSIRQ